MRSVSGTRLHSVMAACAVLTLVAGCGVSAKHVADPTTDPRPTAQLSSTSTTSTPAPATTSPLGGAWVLVTDTPSGLSFRLPKKPTLLTPPLTAPDGATVKARRYQALLPNLLVQVWVYELAGRSFDADKAIDGLASGARGTVTARKHTASGGLDIVDAKVRIPTGPALGYDRVFKIGDYAVQLWTVGLASDEQQIRAVQQRLSSTFRSS